MLAALATSNTPDKLQASRNYCSLYCMCTSSTQLRGSRERELATCLLTSTSHLHTTTTTTHSSVRVQRLLLLCIRLVQREGERAASRFRPFSRCLFLLSRALFPRYFPFTPSTPSSSFVAVPTTLRSLFCCPVSAFFPLVAHPRRNFNSNHRRHTRSLYSRPVFNSQMMHC